MSTPPPAVIQTTSPTGTSTIGTRYQSSTVQTPLAQAVTASQITPIQSQPIASSSDTFFQKFWPSISSAIVAGIIGYFSSIMALKDDINENKKEISVTKNEIVNIHENIKRMEDDVKDIPKINIEIAVMREKLTNGKK